jgi:hypothetical protein
MLLEPPREDTLSLSVAHGGKGDAMPPGSACVRLFTPEEANALVPRVRPLLVALRDAYHGFTFAREQWEELESFGQGASAEAATLQREAEAQGARVEEIIGELRGLGCEPKDPTLGLVDFYGQRKDGSVVLLCYRDDEDAIRFWHPVETGFQGRRPLSEF